MRITKTKRFKPSVCNIHAIVGWKKQNALRTEDEIIVTKDEFKKINEKNPNWFIEVAETVVEEEQNNG